MNNAWHKNLILANGFKQMSTPPQCQWACDNPQCSADCKAVADPPICTCPSNPSFKPQCVANCPEGTEGIQTQCPQCEVNCVQPLPYECPEGIYCEPLTAGWACRTPPDCPYPRCEQQCEAPPTCAWTGPDPWANTSSTFHWTSAIIVGSCIYGFLLLAFLGYVYRK